MKSPLSAILLAAGLALGLSSTAAATSSQNSGGTQATSTIVDAFTDFAGSQENAESLVNGLRSGGEITLTGAGDTNTGSTDTGGRVAASKGGTTTTTAPTTTTTTFTSPTGPMGYGEAYMSLALAKDQLAAYEIDNPTPSQIAAALNGGTVNTQKLGDIQLQGVLNMRAEGMGWGRIAQAQGTKLGWVVGALKSNGAMAGVTPASFSGASGTSVTTAAGGRAAASKGGTTTGGGIVDAGSATHGASGTADSGHGIRNAMGGNAASGHAYVHGGTKSHGVVTSTGASAGAAFAGAGIVNAGGGGGYAHAAAAGVSHGRGAGVVSAMGDSSGGYHEHAHGHGDGHAYGHGFGHHGR